MSETTKEVGKVARDAWVDDPATYPFSELPGELRARWARTEAAVLSHYAPALEAARERGATPSANSADYVRPVFPESHLLEQGDSEKEVTRGLGVIDPGTIVSVTVRDAQGNIVRASSAEGEAVSFMRSWHEEKAARIKAEAERDDAADDAVDFVFKHLACALGLSAWTQEDGSETWQGDVCATLMRMLRDAKVIDPETDELAVDRAERAESELSTLKRQLEARGGVSEEAVKADEIVSGVMNLFPGADRQALKLLARLLTKQDAPPLMCGAGWKTIDSAPKDGTWFWAYYDSRYEEDRQRACRWRDRRGWEDAADSMNSDPTHWMPLPAAPAPTAQKTERPS